MLERLRSGATDAELDEHRDEQDTEQQLRTPGKRVREDLYAAALGTMRRKRASAAPGKSVRTQYAAWMPPPGTIASDRAFSRLIARTIVDATAPLVDAIISSPKFGGARAAASVADASVQSAINEGGAARASAEEAVRAASAAGEQLPPEMLERMGRTLGHTFAHVRIHVGPAADAAARSLGARAFTLGSHIYFADGAYAPGTAAGDRLLRHELTHVVQYDRGLLRATGGGLEVAEDHSATEIEARAAENLDDAPAPAKADAHAAPAKPHAVEAPADASLPKAGLEPALASAGPAKTAGPSASAGPTTAAPSGGVASPWSLEGSMMSLVKRVAPGLAQLLEGGLEGKITTIVNSAVQAGVKALIPQSPLGGLTSVGISIKDICDTLVGAANGDAKCCETFKKWCEKLGELAKKGAKSKFVEDFKKAFDGLDKLVSGVVKLFGGALVDEFRQELNDLRALGGLITDGINKVAAIARPIADKVLAFFHLPSVAQIEGALNKLADKVFKGLKKLAAPALAALKAVVKAFYELSGLKAIVDALAFAGELIEVTKWLIAHRVDENIVKHAHEQMAHTFLPKLLDSMGGLVGKLQAAVAWLENHMTVTLALAAGLGLVLLGPLAVLAIAIGAIVLALKALWGVIGPTITKLWNDLKALVVKAYNYAKPVIDTLTQVGFVIMNPWAAPMVIASSAWLLLPECFKGPLLNLFLDLIIALLTAMPSSVALMGPLWRFVRAGAIGFFTEVRNSWTDGDKVKAIDRIAHLGSGRSTEMMAGFVVGLFKGVVYGVIDPFKMVYELLKIGVDVTEFLAKLAFHKPQIAGVINKHLPAIKAKAEAVMAAGRAALDDFLKGKIGFDELWALLGKFMDSIDAKAGEIGAKAAGKLKGWVLGGVTDWDIGETIGIVIGYIVVFLLIAYFSAGISVEAEGALAVVRTVAKVLNAPYELLGAALKPLGVMFKPVLKALAAVGEKLGLKAVWQGAMKAVEGLASILGKVVEEIILAIEGKLAERAAQKLLTILTEKVGAELAEKLIAELGEKVAQELIDKLGADLVKKLGESLGPKAIEALADKLGQELIEKLLEKGLSASAIEKLAEKAGKELIEKLLEKGLSGAQIEHLVGVFEKEGLELLLAEGVTGPDLVRLGELKEATLRQLLIDLDAKAVLALEETLGKEALEKLAEKLSGKQIQELVEKAGKELIEKLAEKGLSGPQMQHLVNVFEKEGLEILLAEGLTGPELVRLGELNEATLRKLLPDLTGREILDLEAQLGKTGLDRLCEKLDAAQIKDWIADFGADKVKEFAEKYGGEAMEKYGKEFFRNWKGIPADTQGHVTTAIDGFTRDGGVKGCHDAALFDATYKNATPKILEVHTTNTSGPLTEYKYSMMKADGSGPKAGTHTKTVQQGLAGNWTAIEAELNAALDKKIADKTFPVADGGPHRVTISSGTWEFYWRGGKISTIYPVL